MRRHHLWQPGAAQRAGRVPLPGRACSPRPISCTNEYLLCVPISLNSVPMVPAARWGECTIKFGVRNLIPGQKVRCSAPGREHIVAEEGQPMAGVGAAAS